MNPNHDDWDLEDPTGQLEGKPRELSDMPWWGWPIVIIVVPLAIPVALAVLAGEKVYYWWHKRRSK